MVEAPQSTAALNGTESCASEVDKLSATSNLVADGAGNIYFVELLESEELPRLKPRNEAEALFAAAGAEPGD